jgi:hypothetical protein
VRVGGVRVGRVLVDLVHIKERHHRLAHELELVAHGCLRALGDVLAARRAGRRVRRPPLAGARRHLILARVERGRRGRIRRIGELRRDRVDELQDGEHADVRAQDRDVAAAELGRRARARPVVARLWVGPKRGNAHVAEHVEEVELDGPRLGAQRVDVAPDRGGARVRDVVTL